MNNRFYGSGQILNFSKCYKLLNDKCYNLDSKSSYTSGRHLFSLLLLVYLEFSLTVFWTEKQGSAASVDVNAHLIFSGAHKFSNMKKTTLHKKYRVQRNSIYYNSLYITKHTGCQSFFLDYYCLCVVRKRETMAILINFFCYQMHFI